MALLRKETCNLRHAMHLRHPVFYPSFYLAQHSTKRAPHPIKTALQSAKRAQHSIRKALDSIKKGFLECALNIQRYSSHHSILRANSMWKRAYIRKRAVYICKRALYAKEPYMHLIYNAILAIILSSPTWRPKALQSAERAPLFWTCTLHRMIRHLSKVPDTLAGISRPSKGYFSDI